MDYRLPGSSTHVILQARIVEWVAIPSPGDLPNLGIEPSSPALQADSLQTELWGKPSDATYNPDSIEEGSFEDYLVWSVMEKLSQRK